MPNRLKYIYECENCERSWRGFGVDKVFCKKCKHYFKAEYINDEEDADFSKIYKCNCRINRRTRREERIIRNQTVSFSRCYSCRLHVQGFLYSKFHCNSCYKSDFVKGLQEYSNQICRCDQEMINEDFENEYELISEKEGIQYYCHFTCERNSCQNEWTSYYAYGGYNYNRNYQKCESCYKKNYPYNWQFKIIKSALRIHNDYEEDENYELEENENYELEENENYELEENENYDYEEDENDQWEEDEDQVEEDLHHQTENCGMCLHLDRNCASRSIN